MVQVFKQLSAFSFKNWLITKRRKGVHIGLLFVIQTLLVLGYYQINSAVSGRLRNERDASRDVRAYIHEKYFNVLYQPDINIGRDKFLLICEDESQENVVLRDKLRTLMGRELHKDHSLTSAHDFDEWCHKSYEETYYSYSYDLFTYRNVRGAIIIKKPIVDKNGAFSHYDVAAVRGREGEFFRLLNFVNEALRNIATDGNDPEDDLKVVEYQFRESKELSEIRYANFALALASTLCVSLTVGLFVVLCIGEKEDKILMLLRLNGVSFRGYFLAQWIHFMLLSVIPTIMGILCFLLNPLMTFQTHHSLAFFFFFNMASHNVMVGVILSMFFKRAMVAIVACILFALIGNNAVSVVAYKYNLWYLNYLPLVGNVTAIGSLASMQSKVFSEVILKKEIWGALLFGVLGNFLLYFLCSYLYNVLEQGYSGTLKPWHYPISEFFAARKEKALMQQSALAPVESLDIMDSDVREMAQLVNSNHDQLVQSHSLVYRNVRKIYKGGKMAVDDVSLALKGNQIFGLLGPNGAGKTTLMHITAGLYEASGGSVVLEGHDSRLNRDEYLSKIGFCPQHDIYWKLLTVGEHLRFFEILRATPINEIDERINQTLDSVRLSNYKTTLATKVSGGERRRMSLAMALSGDSRVVLLDEPTTGLDPKVRRMVWDIISETRQGRLVILTTHSMEEAELLSEHITIMAHGRLRCLGTPNHLKQKFGGQVFVNFENEPGRFQDALAGVRESCPDGSEVSLVSEGLGSISGRMRYTGDKKQSLILMRNLLNNKGNYGIKTFGIVQSSLDDVFMNIVRASDADA